MSLSPDRRIPPANQVPVYRYDEQRAHDAWECHRVLLLTERDRPWLRENPQWLMLRADAFEQFALSFEALT